MGWGRDGVGLMGCVGMVEMGWVGWDGMEWVGWDGIGVGHGTV